VTVVEIVMFHTHTKNILNHRLCLEELQRTTLRSYTAGDTNRL